MFTLEQIEEIHRKLQLFGVKDMDLPTLTEQLDGSEVLTLIKNGRNIQLMVSQFLNFDMFTPEQLESLRGPQGLDGKNAYQTWLAQGNVGTYDDYLTILQLPALTASETLTITVNNKLNEADNVIIRLNDKNTEMQQIISEATIAKDLAQEVFTHPPAIINGYWHLWNHVTNQYDTTYVKAAGDTAYEIWLAEGNTGTKEDFLADIKGDPFLYSDFTPEQIVELQQPAADAIASIEAVEQSVEQAEALRVQAEQSRQTNTATAIQNAENAATNAGNAASLANEKAGLANDAATLANTKAGLADTAATNANTKAGLADAAATNANNVANGYAAELAAKELKANKQNSLAVDGTGTKFPTVDAVNAKNTDLESLFLRKLVAPLGATYNTTSKLYSLNGLTDITEEQMINIYNYTAVMIKASSWIEAFNNVNFRTNIQGTNKGNLGISANYSFTGNAHLEVFKMNGGVYTTNTTAMFGYCPALREVNFIYMQMALASQADSMFYNCSALVTCNLRILRVNLSFAWSPLLSLESLKYLIQYRANGTTPITITVHPTVFAKLTDNTNYPTWYAVNQDALTKYITFASA